MSALNMEAPSTELKRAQVPMSPEFCFSMQLHTKSIMILLDFKTLPLCLVFHVHLLKTYYGQNLHYFWISTSNLQLILLDGGKNPTFQEKFIFTLIEGLRELNVVVWNSRTLSADEHIGTGR